MGGSEEGVGGEVEQPVAADSLPFRKLSKFHNEKNARRHFCRGASKHFRIQQTQQYPSPIAGRHAPRRARTRGVARIAVRDAVAASHGIPHIKAVARAAETGRGEGLGAHTNHTADDGAERDQTDTRNEFLHVTPH